MGANTISFGGEPPPTSSSCSSEHPVEARVCPACGRASSSGNVFCPFDGEKLIAEAIDPVMPDPLLGVTVDDRYEVLAVIGEGGMGRVYRVRHRRLGRSFALKALRLELAREGNLAERFMQEARAAAVVTHPNVVQINDFGTLHTGQPYFVMELLEGRTLARIIREEGPIEPSRCLAIAKQIAEAIAAAHAGGVIHRDLKPDNVILVRPSGSHTTVKVLDFGLAKVAGANRLTRPGVVFGTPHYMSPEQAGGEQFDHRVDIYALGVIMFEMLTGHVPFEADTYMGVLSKHLYEQPPKLRDFKLPHGGKSGLEEIIMRCLAKKLDDRWPSMTELARRLNVLAASSTLESASFGSDASSVSASPGAIRPAKTRTLRVIVSAAMVLLLLFMSVAWFVTRRRLNAINNAPDRPSAVSVSASAVSPASAAAGDLQPGGTGDVVRQAANPDPQGTASASATIPPNNALQRPVTDKAGRRAAKIAPKPPNKAGFGAGEIRDPWAK